MTDTYLVLEGLHNEDPKHDARLYQVAVVDCGVFHWVMESDQPAVIDEATLCSSSNLFAHAIRQQTASKPCPGVFSRRSRKHKHNDDGHNHSPPMRIWFGLFGPNRFAFDVENPEQIVDADTIEKVLRTSMIRRLLHLLKDRDLLEGSNQSVSSSQNKVAGDLRTQLISRLEQLRKKVVQLQIAAVTHNSENDIDYLKSLRNDIVQERNNILSAAGLTWDDAVYHSASADEDEGEIPRTPFGSPQRKRQFTKDIGMLSRIRTLIETASLPSTSFHASRYSNNSSNREVKRIATVQLPEILLLSYMLGITFLRDRCLDLIVRRWSKLHSSPRSLTALSRLPNCLLEHLPEYIVGHIREFLNQSLQQTVVEEGMSLSFDHSRHGKHTGNENTERENDMFYHFPRNNTDDNDNLSEELLRSVDLSGQNYPDGNNVHSIEVNEDQCLADANDRTNSQIASVINQALASSGQQQSHSQSDDRDNAYSCASMSSTPNMHLYDTYKTSPFQADKSYPGKSTSYFPTKEENYEFMGFEYLHGKSVPHSFDQPLYTSSTNQYAWNGHDNSPNHPSGSNVSTTEGFETPENATTEGLEKKPYDTNPNEDFVMELLRQHKERKMKETVGSSTSTSNSAENAGYSPLSPQKRAENSVEYTTPDNYSQANTFEPELQTQYSGKHIHNPVTNYSVSTSRVAEGYRIGQQRAKRQLQREKIEKLKTAKEAKLRLERIKEFDRKRRGENAVMSAPRKAPSCPSYNQHENRRVSSDGSSATPPSTAESELAKQRAKERIRQYKEETQRKQEAEQAEKERKWRERDLRLQKFKRLMEETTDEESKSCSVKGKHSRSDPSVNPGSKQSTTGMTRRGFEETEESTDRRSNQSYIMPTPPSRHSRQDQPVNAWMDSTKTFEELENNLIPSTGFETDEVLGTNHNSCSNADVEQPLELNPSTTRPPSLDAPNGTDIMSSSEKDNHSGWQQSSGMKVSAGQQCDPVADGSATSGAAGMTLQTADNHGNSNVTPFKLRKSKSTSDEGPTRKQCHIESLNVLPRTTRKAQSEGHRYLKRIEVKNKADEIQKDLNQFLEEEKPPTQDSRNRGNLPHLGDLLKYSRKLNDHSAASEGGRGQPKRHSASSSENYSSRLMNALRKKASEDKFYTDDSATGVQEIEGRDDWSEEGEILETRSSLILPFDGEAERDNDDDAYNPPHAITEVSVEEDSFENEGFF